MMGKIVSIALLIYGAISALNGTVNLSLLVLPFFIYISANKEEDMLMYTVIKDVINKKKYIKDKKVMDAVEICAYESTAIREVLKYFDKNKFHIIIVINDNMDIEDVLTEAQILNSLSEHGSNTTLSELCRKMKR
jgi:stage IV sporulation protein FB